ncbi:hypothetical protein PUW24_06110 [Paenibacillus urinalis]|uniref:Uncharacterized protein n=1 Tax=Paenibacillus urinalis TaxID=521520 RepID=A0AAX3N147_9BACL|nr:hypothetical protein [Paenibacillus urinalis]WDH82440.1 hypothetical protein PUW23_23840 [Paenibacillus urinalis]WDH98497.1 hypothetical protein PUW24_06110 [Paenibacillus urinalis]WDI02188.1 hypothetical protein PUW25_23835 [Paenibacillus urinalis]
MVIKGLKSLDTWDVTEERDYSLEEIRELLRGGKHSVFLVVMKYEILGVPCFGSGLTLWDETHAPILRDGRLVVSTYFRRADLGQAGGIGDPEEPIPVDVVIDPNEPILFISVKRVHAAPHPLDEIIHN